MKTLLKISISSLFFLGIFFFFGAQNIVRADVCWSSRVVSQWYCGTGGTYCADPSPIRRCAGPAPVGGQRCSSSGWRGSGRNRGYCNCVLVCDSLATGQVCAVVSTTATCTGDPNNCRVSSPATSCVQNSTRCSIISSPSTLGCWGPGNPPAVCGNGRCESGEGCTSCSADCSCTGPRCGDGRCNGSESCGSCAGDCGACPVPPSSCGDGACNNGENCGTCAPDCGMCPTCGNGVCDGGDTCAGCPGDCGACPGPTCGNNVCEAGETCSSCPGDCRPACSPACGQTICGTTCANTDAGAPGTVTLTPANGGSVTLSGTNQVTLSWTAATKANLYNVQVYPTGTAAGAECTAAGTFCQTGISATSYTFTFTGTQQDYSWRVQAVNSRCSTPETSSWTSGTFTVNGEISGTIFHDPNEVAVFDIATNRCTFTGSTPNSQPPGGGSGIEALWGTNNRTNGQITGSTYTIQNIPYTNSIQVALNLDRNKWRCVCPSGCTYTGQSLPKSGLNFFLTDASPAWWQTSNGLVYGGSTTGTAISSLISDKCTTPGCKPGLSLKDAADTANSTGFIITGGGGIDTTEDENTQYTNLNEESRTERFIGHELTDVQENYEFFSSQYSMGSSPAVDFTGVKPAGNPTNGRAFYATGDITISSSWSVSSSEKFVIFVNGDLRIRENITVDPGGFLAFIVKGDIIFDKDLGHTDHSLTTPLVAGIFIANDKIIVESAGNGGDRKFVGAGSFVGWGGVTLARQYANQKEHETRPTDVFIFRPDLLLNAPEKMTRPYYLWQETN